MSENAAAIAYIADQNGERKPYKLFSARLPEFLAKYPIEDGYRVVVQHADYISSQATLIELYKLAIQAGKSPLDLCLPSLPNPNTHVFTATLFDPDGQVISAATACKEINFHKDWEAGETAARQRLIASLGFGGDVFDQDELKEIISRQREVGSYDDTSSYPFIEDKGAQSEPTQEHLADFQASMESGMVASEKAPEPEGETEASAAVIDEGEEAEQVEQEPEQSNIPDASEATSETQQAEQVPQDEDKGVQVEEVPLRYLMQLEHQAQLHGKPTPQPKTVSEAKKMLKDFLNSGS